MPLNDIHDFIGLTVAVEVCIGHIGLDIQQADIAVEQERHAIERWRSARCYARGQKMAMTQRRVRVGLPHHVAHLAGRHDRRGRMHVIQQRRRAHEALMAHEFFRIQAAVGTPKHGVPFAGIRTERVVDGHERLRGFRAVPAHARWIRTVP